MDVVLASTSPYRRMLLERLGVPFRCEGPEVDESAWPTAGKSPETLVEELAAAKAQSVATQYPQAVVLGSDQVVALDGAILGKPGSPEAAIAQLQRLRGTTHRLVTGLVAVGPGSPPIHHVDVTTLVMRAMTDDEIARYVEAERAWDCAGSYKLESLGISLFDRIDSQDPTAMIGLPLIATAGLLRHFGVPVP